MYVVWACEILDSNEAPPAALLLPQALHIAGWQPLRLTPATAAAARRRPRTCTRGGSPDGTAPACARAAQPSEQGRGDIEAGVERACRAGMCEPHKAVDDTCAYTALQDVHLDDLVCTHGLATMHTTPTAFCCPPARPPAPPPPRSPCAPSAWGQGGSSCMVGVPNGLPIGSLSDTATAHHTVLTMQHHHHPPCLPSAQRPQTRAPRTCQSRPGRQGVASLRQGSEGCAQ